MARSQEHKKNPRPRTGASVLQKKGLQKFFSGDLQITGYPEFLIGGGLNHKSHEMTYVIKIFPKRKFLCDKDVAGWKI